MSDHKKAPSGSFSAASQAPQRKKVRDRLLIAGPTFAGKTQLYYKLMGHNIGDRVSSSDVNECAESVGVKVPQRLLQSTSSNEECAPAESNFATIEAKLVDVPGHYNFKTALQTEASGAKAIIVLLDSKEKNKFGEAAEVIYDLLSDIEIVDQQIPILVTCNKQDVVFAKNPLQIEREITNEIEQIRKVRKATQAQ